MLDARRLGGVTRPTSISILVNDRPVDCHPGETLAAALIADGTRRFRTSGSGAPRAPYCNMGVCFDCMVTVDGAPFVRACLIGVKQGMRVEVEGLKK